jgi:two-component system, OmpR family, sensor histidine kinase KdpD
MYLAYRKYPPGSWGYFLGPLLVLLVTLIGYLLQRFLDPTNIAMLYLLCVAVTAIRWGRGPSILVCCLSVLAHDFFFVKPLLNFGPPSLQDVPNLIGLLTIGIIISALNSRIRQQNAEAQRRETETRTLYIISRNLAITQELDESVAVLVRNAREILGYDLAFFLPDERDSLLLKPFSTGNVKDTGTDEIKVAAWVFQNHQKAGRGTGTFRGGSSFIFAVADSTGRRRRDVRKG